VAEGVRVGGRSLGIERHSRKRSTSLSPISSFVLGRNGAKMNRIANEYGSKVSRTSIQIAFSRVCVRQNATRLTIVPNYCSN
jgi:hypothetical protein